jgi:DNA-binding CsgD family transcriptional regulator
MADLETALSLYRPCGHRWGLSDSLGYLGLIVCETGEVARAAALLSETLEMRSSMGTTENLPTSLADVATLANASGQPGAAVRLFGAAASLQELFGTPPMLPERTAYERATANARAALGDAFAADWAAGRHLTPETALPLAQEVLSIAARWTAAGASTAAATPGDPAGLTIRELDVLRLVAAGQSNQEIADALGISILTVKTHVANILAKLGLPTRIAVAGYVHRHGIAQ